MRWFKKIVRAILNLLPLFAVVFITTSDVSALRHEYNGISLFSAQIPTPVYNSSTEKYELDWNYSNNSQFYNFGVAGIQLAWEGDAYDSNWLDSLNLQSSSSFITSNFYEGDTQYQYSSLSPQWVFTDSGDPYYLASDSRSYFPSNFRNIPIPEQVFTRHRFGDSIPSFDLSSLPEGLLSCDKFSNGAVCGGLWNTKEYINSQILPYPYSYDGFYLKSKYIDTDSGMHYTNTFSLSDLLNKNVPKFSQLSINLDNYDGYFYNPENLYKYRQIEFKGVFEFDGSFSWHNNISNNGSHFQVVFSGFSADDGDYHTQTIDCSTVVRELPSENYIQLEYSCPAVLEYNYLNIAPYLDIYGNGNYVWLTDSDWRFSNIYIVTDNDDTLGSSFNSNLTGGGSIPGDAKNQAENAGNPDFFSSLSQMFSFSFLNPFAPLFNMFSDSSSCASIPTIAGMIHSEESQVCPFFDSTTRNIMTPILGIVAMMLVFGFAVRWLGAQSGNYYDDSDQGKFNSGGIK